MSKTILITGGAGFIGSNFIHYYHKKYPNDLLINVDALTYAADLNNLGSISESKNYIFKHGNICDRAFIESIFEEYSVSDVIHFAAESHVDNSISHPDIFVQTNVHGTFVLLDVAYKFWMLSPQKYKEKYTLSRFIHISTDEVYGSLQKEGYFTEESNYAPNSPYSASKASADMLARSYFYTYGLHVNITNCSNNFGKYQHDEKLIPTIIRSALQSKPIPIYGDGENIRDWLHVDDHCRAIERVFIQAKAGENYNIGANNEKNNNQIAKAICDILDELKPKKNSSYSELIHYVKDRAGHDRRYAIDASKIQRDLEYCVETTFSDALRQTVEFYIDKYK